MRFKCWIGLHEYEQTREEDILKCKHCGRIIGKGYFLGIKIVFKQGETMIYECGCYTIGLGKTLCKKHSKRWKSNEKKRISRTR